MQACSIYDRSLKFSRLMYGILVLIAYFLKLEWLILLVAVLTLLGALSLSFNIPYQLHMLGQRKKGIRTTDKDSGELSFVSAATGLLLLVGYLLLALTSYETFAWIYILIVDAMIFMACLLGFCVATLMYVLIKNKLKPKKV